MSIATMKLVWPDAQYLPGYVRALRQNWSPDNLRPAAAAEELARIEEDPARFLSVFLATRNGCGTVNSAGPSVFAGNQARRNFLPIAWDILDILLCPGSGSVDMQLAL
jgi:hypothetical protein